MPVIMVSGKHYINIEGGINMVGIVLLGQSNSGKSTLGKVVAERYGIRYISSGDIARSMKDIQLQKDLNSGEMAPEDKMRSMILHEINSSDKPYILDGFPRFYEQYEWLNQNIDYDLVYVSIEVPYEDILARAMQRSIRDDGYISKKMEFYEQKTEPMIRDIFADGCNVYIISNGNDRSIREGIDALSKIVEESIC